MRFELDGAVAVVTGAGGGIGAATARLLAEKGADLALADVNAANLEKVAEECRARGATVSTYAFDIADADTIAALPDQVLARHGRVNVLVNNAGVALMGRGDQVTLEDFAWLMDINFWGVVRMTHAFLPHLKRQPAAHIVNVSSIFGVIAPPAQGPYCASKFAVRGYSESLRHELKDTNLGVTVVHPGGVNTNIANAARVSPGIEAGDADEARDAFGKMLRTEPEAAAARIVDAIERRKRRILIGPDAQIMEFAQRLLPGRYWDIFSRFAREDLKRFVQQDEEVGGSAPAATAPPKERRHA